MIKARFIDKILEALGDEAWKIEILDNTIHINFYDTDNINNRKIASIISLMHLEDGVFEYGLSKIVIDYGLKTLRIETKNRKVIIKNFGKYGTTGLWTMVMEILEVENVEM